MALDLELLGYFCEETEELLQHWEKLCDELQGEARPATLAKLFRLAHTIKGSSRCAGMTDFANFVQKVEELIQAEQKSATPTNLSVLLIESKEFLAHWTENLKDSPYYKPSEIPSSIKAYFFKS